MWRRVTLVWGALPLLLWAAPRGLVGAGSLGCQTLAAGRLQGTGSLLSPLPTVSVSTWSLCTGTALHHFLLLVCWGLWGGSLSPAVPPGGCKLRNGSSQSIWSPDLTCFPGRPSAASLRPPWGHCGGFSAQSVLLPQEKRFRVRTHSVPLCLCPTWRDAATCCVTLSPSSSVTTKVNPGAGGEGVVVLSPLGECCLCCRSGTRRRASSIT